MNLIFGGFGPNVKQFFETYKGKKVVEVITLFNQEKIKKI